MCVDDLAWVCVHLWRSVQCVPAAFANIGASIGQFSKVTKCKVALVWSPWRLQASTLWRQIKFVSGVTYFGFELGPARWKPPRRPPACVGIYTRFWRIRFCPLACFPTEGLEVFTFIELVNGPQSWLHRFSQRRPIQSCRRR